MLTYRLLPAEEYETLHEFIKTRPAVMALPDPTTSVVHVVEDDGKLVAFWVAEAVIHMGAEWVEPEYRKKFAIAPKLFALTMQELRRRDVTYVMAFIDDPEVRGTMLERLGFKHLPGSLYGGEV